MRRTQSGKSCWQNQEILQHFSSQPVEDDGASQGDDDNNKPEKLPQRSEVFSTCEQERVGEVIAMLPSNPGISSVSIAFTDEIPRIKAGLLGEFDPVLLQTQHPGNMKKVWKCISGVHIDIG